MLKKYVIERDVAGIGTKSRPELGDAAVVSNAALAELDGIQWQHSYVTNDKTFCIYLADSYDKILAHANRSGFPATKVTEVVDIFDPSTAAHSAEARVAA